MKKGIAIAVVAGLFVTGVLLAQKNEGDAGRAADVLSGMTAAELNGPASDPNTVGPPDLSDPVILAVLEMLKNPEAHGGLLEIARANGCSMGQIKVIMAEKAKHLRSLAEAEIIP